MSGLASTIRIFSKTKLFRIHEATLKILQETGVVFKSEEARDIFKHHGAKVDGELVLIPRPMLDAALDASPPGFKWWAKDITKFVYMGEEQDRTHVSPNQGPIYIQDIEHGRRLGKLEDLINLYKLCQASTVCDIVGAIPVAPSDIAGSDRHLQITYALLKHVDKPLIGFVGRTAAIREMFDMVEIAFGRKGYLVDHPCMAVSVNPLSPLQFDEEACETLITYAKHRQPVFVLSCAQAGVTAPANLTGTIVLQNAEMLAGLVLTQLISPEMPFVYSPASAVPNMQNASYVTGSPESNMINIVGLQLAREIYDLPCRSMAGLTDAKTVDCQSGYETMQNLWMLMLAGVHLINECLGVLDSIMTTSYEKFIIDKEMISRSLTLLRGLDASDQSLAVDAIQEIGPGGNYLMHPSTLESCRSFWKPYVSFWGSHDDWVKKGSEDIRVRANREYKRILADCPDSLLDPTTERDLKAYMATKSK